MDKGRTTKKLEDVLEALIDYRGKTPKKTTSGIPLVTAKVVKKGRILQPNEFIAEGDYESWMRRGIPMSGDVVLTTEAPLGEVAQIKNANIALAQRIVTLRGTKGILDNGYLKYFLLSRIGQSRLKARQSGTTVFGIKQSELRKVNIDFPPLPEQKAIATILSALDDKIELNLQMNKTLEEMAMALYKHWFVDFGPFQDGKFVDSELGMIPEEWEVKKLEDIVEVCSSKRIFSREYIDFGVPFYRGKEVIQLSNGDEISNPLYISEDRFKEIDQKFGSPKRNDILVSSVGTIGRAWQVDNDDPFYFKDGNLTWIKNYNQEIDASYVYQWIISHEAQSQIRNATIGSTQQALTISSLRNILIIVPPLKLKLIADVISRIEIWRDKININRKEIKTLSKTRDTLLPKLISGEVRLKEFQEMIEQTL